MFAIKHDGTLWACGNNGYGQLGLGDYNDRSTFTQVSNMTDVKQVACGSNHVLVLKNDGNLYACGANGYGQYGDGYTESYGNYGTFLRIRPEVSGTIDYIACGYESSFLITTYGYLYSTGANSDGQLGVGDYDDRVEFTKVSVTKTYGSSTRIKKVESNYGSTYIQFEDNYIYSTGLNESGQLGIGTTSNSSTFKGASDGYADAYDLASAGPTAEHMMLVDDSYFARGSGSSGCLGGAGEYGQDYAYFGQVTLQ